MHPGILIQPCEFNASVFIGGFDKIANITVWVRIICKNKHLLTFICILLSVERVVLATLLQSTILIYMIPGELNTCIRKYFAMEVMYTNY